MRLFKMSKTIAVTLAQWNSIHNDLLSKAKSPKFLLRRSRMIEQFGFVPRYAFTTVFLDFYSDQKLMLFKLEYSEMLND